ncbi:MAG: S49 family peptidase [Phycisphaeraceae bacterium]|nr:S49 family peptidase [Phycisphaeraceae bacterium]
MTRGAKLALAAVMSLSVMAQAQPKVGLLEIKGSPKARPAELSWLMGSSEPTLREIVDAIEAAAADEAVGPIVIRLKDASLTSAQVEEIGAAIRKVQGAGKKVNVFSEGYGPAELLLGSYADKVLIQKGGPVSLPGLFMEEMYLADTLNWIGVKADLVQVGDYKGANEMFVNNAPSKAWEQNINQLLDSLYGEMRERLKVGRKLSDAKLDDAMKSAWMADDEEAMNAGLVDSGIDLPGLGEAVTGRPNAKIQKLAAGEESSLALGTGNPMTEMMAMMRMLSEKPRHKATMPTIAVLHIDGTIIDGDSSGGGMFGDGGSVGSRTIRNAIEDIRSQDLIKGVVVRIDSPGGSATASEVIWQGLRRLSETKPVWVSVGSMAASGGYYIAVGGDRIYVNPSSIVGSIGVVGGKLSMGGLYDMAKVKTVGRGRGPRADMFDSTKAWSPEQLAMVRDKMKRTFDLFTRRVAEGRQGIDLSKTAGGWLFAGKRAIELKMADKIGGLDLAISDLASDRGLTEYAVMDYPAPRSLPEVLEDAFKGFGVRAPGASGQNHLVMGLRELVGERAWPSVRSALSGLMLLRDQPVVLVMPRAIIVR